jgi:DNA end-binding protein Ku
MARPIASLTISFGLVAIPVKVISATESSGSISFNLLHEKCGSRLKQQYVCAREGVIVERNEMVKGYEFAKDQYVRFTADEIKQLEEIASPSIDIEEFVPWASVDPMYFDRSYYLAPDDRAEKAYALLARALDDSKLVAIGHWSARGKQYLVALRPVQGVLVMQQLHYADEIRPIREAGVETPAVGERELKLALQLIDSQAKAAFDPAEWKDEVRERIQEQIERKIGGEEISVAEGPKREAKVIDLMEALQASLKQRGGDTRRGERKPPKRATARAAPARSRGKATRR